MSFSRPTLSEIIDRVRTDLSSRLSGSSTALRRQAIGVLATVFSGAVHLMYGFLDYVSKQVLPDTAEGDWLIRWGAIKGLSKNEATFCELTVEFVGTNGLVIEEGAELVSNDGAVYEVTADATVAAGVAEVSVVATTEGEDGNLEVSDTLTLSEPIAGIESEGEVTEVVSSGVDEESDEDFQERLLQRLREVPQGGAEADYEAWALEVSGVTRVWVRGNEPQVGSVTVFFVRDNDVSIIPSAGEIEEVEDYIDTVRPVTARLYVEAPTPDEVDFTIELTPDTAAVRAAVEAELEDLILREAEPGGTLPLSKIREAVSTAAGEDDNEVTVPAADVVSAAGHIPVMGTITWV